MHLKILFMEQDESCYVYIMSKIVKMKENGTLPELDW
jgi:hypothetical protein